MSTCRTQPCVCEHCKAPFLADPWKAAHGRARFCSRTCANKYLSPRRAPTELSNRREEIRALYQAGMSTVKIAKQVGARTDAAIWHYVQDITRDRGTAISLGNPPRSKNPHMGRSRARRLMKRVLRRLLHRNEHVHHKDGDPTNNSLENLEILSASAHSSYHAKLRWATQRGQNNFTVGRRS